MTEERLGDPGEEHREEQSGGEAAEPPGPVRPPAAGTAARWRFLVLGGLVAPGAMVLVGAALAWGLRREDLLAALSLRQPWPEVLAWAALGAALSLGSVAGLAQVWRRFGRALERTGLETGEEALRFAGWPVLAVVVAVSGLGEEVFFRGGLQPTLGLPLTSLAFGLAHGGWRLREMWAYVLAAALAGAIFGAVYARTGLLWASVLAHAGHNLATTLYLLYRRRRGR